LKAEYWGEIMLKKAVKCAVKTAGVAGAVAVVGCGMLIKNVVGGVLSAADGEKEEMSN